MLDQLDTETGPAIRLRIDMGCLLDVPAGCWNPRARTWLAIIALDPKAPGGLARTFCARCHGEWYYDAAPIEKGHALEFGADHGRRDRNRRYFVVVDRDATSLLLVEYSTGSEAIRSTMSATGNSE